MKEALILAAGRGLRLNGSSNGDPKCLLEVGGRPLIQHQIAVLRALGVERICIVVGYCADRVRAVVGDSCSYVLNSRFADTNSLYSLWLARDRVTGPFRLAESRISDQTPQVSLGDLAVSSRFGQRSLSSRGHNRTHSDL